MPGESKSINRPKSCKDIKKKLFFLIILLFQIFLTKKLRINTIKRPKPIKANEKVNKNDNPIINVLILDEILCTISDELDGLCREK